MFVRVKKIGHYEYLYLVENVREGGRHVQRVIKALGRRDEVENSGVLDGLIASAARHSRRSIVLSSFYRGELAELRRRSIGPDLVFGHLWRDVGCAAVLRRHRAGRRFSFDVERAIYLTVLHRLMASGSDRHAIAWQDSLEIPGVEALSLNHAYKAMAWLGEAIDGDDSGQTRHGTDTIEEALYQHRKSLFGAISVAFSTPLRCISRATAAPRWASVAIPKISDRNSPKSCLALCWTSGTGPSLRSYGPATRPMSPPCCR
jgi:hypothetical protein